MPTTDALAILDELIGDDTETRENIAEEATKQHTARLIYAARTGAGLTQKELACRIGTSQSVIARLENADYGGHSLTMLRRIADVLDMTVEIKLKPKHVNEYRPAFVETTTTPNIRFSTQPSKIDIEAYRSGNLAGQNNYGDQTHREVCSW